MKMARKETIVSMVIVVALVAAAFAVMFIVPQSFGVPAGTSVSVSTGPNGVVTTTTITTYTTTCVPQSFGC